MQSVRLKIPYIDAAQVEKSVTHNEALALLDVVVGAAVDGFLVNTPPASPAVGTCYVIGDAPTGAWVGHALALAGYTDGGWRFIAAVDGLSALDMASGETVVFRDGTWERGHVRAASLSVGGVQVVGARQAGVSDPAGGSTVDVEARAAIASILAGLRSHGLIGS